VLHRPKILFGSWHEDGASYYGPADSGGSLACGGGDLTSTTTGVANKTMPCGTELEVCYQGCERVTVIDRGPYIEGREFDLTEATARAVGFMSAGVGTIRWRLVAR
jgi:rare lipoprotein A